MLHAVADRAPQPGACPDPSLALISLDCQLKCPKLISSVRARIKGLACCMTQRARHLTFPCLGQLNWKSRHRAGALWKTRCLAGAEFFLGNKLLPAEEPSRPHPEGKGDVGCLSIHPSSPTQRWSRVGCVLEKHLAADSGFSASSQPRGLNHIQQKTGVKAYEEQV